MSFNGSGTFNLAAGNPVVTGTVISSTWANNTLSDIATGLTTCITKDGQTTPTANLPMGTFKLTGLGAGTAAGNSVRYEQVLLLTGGTVTGATTFSGAVTSTGGATVNTAAWKFADAFLQITGSSDATKIGVFEADGITTATTRTYTLPDKNGTFAMTSDVTSGKPAFVSNASFSAVPTANAMVFTLLGADGNALSASNAVSVGFRSATLTSGIVTTSSITAAISTTISSGSTGGTVSAQASRIWLAIIYNAGTPELAWYQTVSGTGILPFDEGGVITTTAEGGAGAADSAGVWYSTTARTSTPFAIIGYMDSTQTTAGTWAQAITSIVINPSRRPGDVIQTVLNVDSAVATGTTTMPIDDTIPQITEGDQYMTQAITPLAAANVLEIDHVGNYTGQAGNTCAVALFQDATAGALAVNGNNISNTGYVMNMKMTHRMIAATIVSTTFRLRFGFAAAGTNTFNGTAGGRLFGGAINSNMSVKEIMV